MPWDDASGEYCDLDDDDLDNSYADSERCDSPEDDRAALRGTSQCDGTCDPQCDWCLVAHRCPDECAGGTCPYDGLDALEGPEYVQVQDSRYCSSARGEHCCELPSGHDGLHADALVTGATWTARRIE